MANYLHHLIRHPLSLLLKKDKGLTNCGSFRPISLLDVDVKIIAKVFALHLELVLPNIISEEQTGFYKKSALFSSVRKLLNVIYSPSNNSSPEVVISFDAEKAFDRIEWGYLFTVIDKFGFGRNLIACVCLLYTSAQVAVCTNSIMSYNHWPLSIALRTSSLVKGVRRGGEEQRMALYADDLFVYLRDSESNIEEVIVLPEDFGSFSGYKVLFKSKCFLIIEKVLQIQQDSLLFHLSYSGFKYLGIKITCSVSSLYTANFTPLLNEMDWTVIDGIPFHYH